MELGLVILGNLTAPNGGFDVGRVVPLPPGARLVVGRSPDCGIHLIPLSVSREHCEVRHDSEGVWVRDLSAAGTYVNGVRVADRVPLRPCDHLQVGPALLRLVFLGPADPDWLSWGGGTVPMLARAVREEGWQGNGRVLHDALVDAGCTDEGVLGHCLSRCAAARTCSLLGLLLAGEG